jgi:hypothetical protein
MASPDTYSQCQHPQRETHNAGKALLPRRQERQQPRPHAPRTRCWTRSTMVLDPLLHYRAAAVRGEVSNRLPTNSPR